MLYQQGVWRSRPVRPRLSVDRLRTRLFMLALWIWCALVSYPMMSYESIRIEDARPDNGVILYQAVGWALYMAVVFGLYLPQFVAVWQRYDPLQYGVCVLLFVSLLIQLQGEPVGIQLGILYTLTLLLTVAAVSVVWTLSPDEIGTCLGGAAIVFCSFGITAVAVLGLSENRNVGGIIQPNLFATPLLAGFILSQFSRTKIMWGVRAACFLLAAAVSSRFAVVGCLIAFVIFEITYKPVSLRFTVMALIGLAGLAIFSQQLVEVLALDDPTRNLDSGLTGRGDEWAIAGENIANNPLGLGYKRPQPADMGHNGYIKTVLEFGVIGGAVMILLVVGITIRAGLDAVTARRGGEILRRFRSARAGGLFALTFAAFFQPQLLNLGDGCAIAFLLLLFAPRGALRVGRRA